MKMDTLMKMDTHIHTHASMPLLFSNVHPHAQVYVSVM